MAGGVIFHPGCLRVRRSLFKQLVFADWIGGLISGLLNNLIRPQQQQRGRE
jgi:hypothetical protein